MKNRICVCVICLALGMVDHVCAAQEGQSTERSTRDELKRLRERLDELDRRHKDDQRLINDLADRLERLESDQRTFLQFKPESLGTPAIPVLPGGEAAIGQGNLFNPKITAIFDLGASFSSNEKNKALRRFNLREVELDIRAAVTPWADGVLIIAIGEEIEEKMPGQFTVDTEFEIEEGYLDFHSLPNDLTLKVGKFRNAFGRNNLLHTHALPQVTRPLAVEQFLGPEGLATIGGS
ncbi:MAG: hypothetical protein IID30_12160, partial [Planctomycetes bacterium]|nr:hypothetical protein [Planctomycetota bacterium]